MKSLFGLRRATKESTFKELALPPGFRKIFLNQLIEGTHPNMMNGQAQLNSPIQITDPTSSHFGEFIFMVGYDG